MHALTLAADVSSGPVVLDGRCMRPANQWAEEASVCLVSSCPAQTQGSLCPISVPIERAGGGRGMNEDPVYLFLELFSHFLNPFRRLQDRRGRAGMYSHIRCLNLVVMQLDSFPWQVFRVLLAFELEGNRPLL